MDRISRIKLYGESLKKTNDWIDSHWRPDGSWSVKNDIDGFFSFAAYANYIGRYDWALSSLRYVQRSFSDRREVLRQGGNRDHMMGYVPAWYCFEAHDVRAFNLSNSLANFLCSFQSPYSGGFFGSREARDSGEGLIDFDSATMSVIALARTGRVDSALKGADYLMNLGKGQPDLSFGFFTEWLDPIGLVELEKLSASSTVLRWEKQDQHYYKMGLYVVSLAHAFGVSGIRKYLDEAVRMYNETINRAKHLWTNTASHKMCWAATILYSMSDDSPYLEHACRITDHLLSVQQKDGMFNYPEFWSKYPPDNWTAIPNAGTQFSQWIARTLRTLETHR